MMSSEWKTRVLIGCGLLLLLVSSAVNVLQAQRISSLLSATKTRSSIVGQKASEVLGVTTDGRKTVVTFKERLPTVLYYFSPTCGWCSKNWMNVQALSAASGGRYRVVAVSSEMGLAGYVRKHQLALEVIEGIGENVRASYGFYGTPHTVVVDGDGLVTHEWRGAYAPRISREVEELFGVVLPGLQAPQLGNSGQ
jgi:hypothetical protein